MKIIINKCYGGFRLSEEAFLWLQKNKGWKITDYNESGHGYKDETAKIVNATEPKMEGMEHYAIPDSDELRIDKDVIACLEVLGEKANSRYSNLVIIEIPDNIEWEVDEYDGFEHVAEKHRTWS